MRFQPGRLGGWPAGARGVRARGMRLSGGVGKPVQLRSQRLEQGRQRNRAGQCPLGIFTRGNPHEYANQSGMGVGLPSVVQECLSTPGNAAPHRGGVGGPPLPQCQLLPSPGCLPVPAHSPSQETGCSGSRDGTKQGCPWDTRTHTEGWDPSYDVPAHGFTGAEAS